MGQIDPQLRSFFIILVAITPMTYMSFYALKECQYQCCLKSIANIDDCLCLQEKQRTREDDEGKVTLIYLLVSL